MSCLNQNVKHFLLIPSLLVSNLNSLATVVWEDFVSQLPQMKGLCESNQLKIIKLLGKFNKVLKPKLLSAENYLNCINNTCRSLQ